MKEHGDICGMVGRTAATLDDITEDDKLKFLKGIKFTDKKKMLKLHAADEDADANHLLTKNDAIKQCNSFAPRGEKAQQLLMAGSQQQDDE